MSLSPLDERYRSRVNFLIDHFSEEAYIRQKCEVELDYLRLLSQLIPEIRDIPANWDFDVSRIREIEDKIRHDTKAIEVYFGEILDKRLIPWIHWGLTSWDVISIASTRQLQQALFTEINEIKNMMNILKAFSTNHEELSMIGRTHGMKASITTVGHFFHVYYQRLFVEIQELSRGIDNLTVKFGGTVGHCDIHDLYYPEVDWEAKFSVWIEKNYQLKRSMQTTQVDSYESWIRVMDSMRRLSGIMLDFVKNVWGYLSLGVFQQFVREDEVGSSIMPHKVNPIQWENAEGNLSMAIGIWETMNRKLIESRYQRDMSDSTVIRNMGVPFGHFQIALSQIMSGLRRLKPNKEFISHELEEHYEVLMEIVQHWLRNHGIPNGYNFIKEKTRGLDSMRRDDYQHIVRECGLYFQIDVPQWLERLSPSSLRKVVRDMKREHTE